MPKFRPPRCQALNEHDHVCGHEMRPRSERDPSFGPSWRPGHTIFQCPYCGAVRVITNETPGRYVESYR